MTRARDVANLIGSGNYSSTTFTATAGQTAFTIAHTQGFVQVFMNGLLLDETVDYTSDGSAVTLTSGAAAGDEIEVVAYNTFSVGDALNQAAADTRYVNTSGDTMTGTLVASTRLQVGDSSITNAYSSNASLGYVADFQGSTGTQTFISIAAPNASSLGDNGVIIGEDATDTYITQRGNKNIKLATQDLSRLNIDGSGRVTMPYQPMFHAWCTDGSNGAVSGNSNPTSFYASLNVGGHFSSGTFTAPIAGKYRFYASILSGAANGGYGLYQFTINNSGAFGGGINNNWGQGYNYGTGNDKSIAKEVIVNLAANDYVKLHVNGSNNNLYWAGGYSYFGGHLLG